MVFLWPAALLLLLFVPLLILAYMLAQRRRQKYAVRYASLSLVKEALGRGPGIRRHIPPALFFLALTTMILALARPQAVVTLPSNEGTIILTIDTSGSMAADDVQPTRMEAAKAAARAFVEKQPRGVQIGIVSFSDNAYTVQPPTDDQDAVIAAINRLQPQRGTAIGRGIMTSLQTIQEATQGDVANTNANGGPLPTPTPLPAGVYSPAIVILLTDGENNQFPDPIEAAQTASDRGVRVYTIGLGTSEGTVLHIGGRSIRTRLDEDTLKAIADTTNAEYFNAQNENDLRAVYEKLGTRFVLKTERQEITFLFTAGAVIFSLMGGILSLLWFNRLP
jgi:Ca-activated chloride channel family protein